MSITISTDVACDGCGVWVYGAKGDRVRTRQARRRASAQGWVHRRGRDLCDLCKVRPDTAADTIEASELQQ